MQVHFTIASHKCGIIHTRFHVMEKKAKLDRAEQYYKREVDWKEAGEWAKRTIERVYCLIILVARAIARDYWHYPQYTVILTSNKWCRKFTSLIEHGPAYLSCTSNSRSLQGLARTWQCAAQPLAISRPSWSQDFWEKNDKQKSQFWIPFVSLASHKKFGNCQ